jgi:hypothetical protein
VILQAVKVILMVKELFELHHCLRVDLGDLLGMMNIVLDSFLVVHLVVEQQCWVVLLDWVGNHLADHPVGHLVDQMVVLLGHAGNGVSLKKQVW